MALNSAERPQTVHDLPTVVGRSLQPHGYPKKLTMNVRKRYAIKVSFLLSTSWFILASLFMITPVWAGAAAPDLVILYTGDGRGNITCVG